MHKNYMVIVLPKEDTSTLEVNKGDIKADFDEAWDCVCSIVEDRAGNSPARPRVAGPCSIELQHELVQIWALTIPEILN